MGGGQGVCWIKGWALTLLLCSCHNGCICSCFTQSNFPFLKSRVSSDSNELLLALTKVQRKTCFQLYTSFLLGYSKANSAFLTYKVYQIKVIKSKLSPRSDSTAWRQFNPIHTKGSHFFFISFLISPLLSKPGSKCCFLLLK